MLHEFNVHRVLNSGTLFGHGTCLFSVMMLRQHISGRGFRLMAEASGELPAGQVAVSGWSKFSRAVPWQVNEKFAHIA
jgi:hypothetical protein